MRIQSIPSSFQLPRVRASLQAPPDPNSDAELARQTREHREFIHEMGRAAAFVGGGTVAGACFAAILGAANHSYRPAQGLLGGIVGFMLGTLMYANNPSEYACNHFIRNPDYPGGD